MAAWRRARAGERRGAGPSAGEVASHLASGRGLGKGPGVRGGSTWGPREGGVTWSGALLARSSRGCRRTGSAWWACGAAARCPRGRPERTLLSFRWKPPWQGPRGREARPRSGRGVRTGSGIPRRAGTSAQNGLILKRWGPSGGSRLSLGLSSLPQQGLRGFCPAKFKVSALHWTPAGRVPAPYLSQVCT